MKSTMDSLHSECWYLCQFRLQVGLKGASYYWNDYDGHLQINQILPYVNDICIYIYIMYDVGAICVTELEISG